MKLGNSYERKKRIILFGELIVASTEKHKTTEQTTRIEIARNREPNPQTNLASFLYKLIDTMLLDLWGLIGRDNSKISFINAGILEAGVWVTHPGFDFESSRRVYNEKHLQKQSHHNTSREAYGY